MIKFILNHRTAVLFVWGIVVSGFTVATAGRLLSGNAVIDNSVGVWFLQDDPERINLDRFNQDFGEKEWTLLLLRTESIFSPEFLDELNQLTQRLERLEHIVKVTSLVNVRDNALDQDEALDYQVIYPPQWRQGGSLTESELASFKHKLFSNPLFEKSLYQRQDSQYTVVLLQNQNLIDNPSPYRIKLTDQIRSIVSDYPSVRGYALAGTTIVNAELNRAAQRDVVVFYTLISLLLLVFGWMTLRNLKDICVLLSAVVPCITSTMGTLALLEIPFNMITVMIPSVLLSLSVAGVIHVINEFHEHHRRESPIQAAALAIKRLWRPNLWTALTTIVGFASLALSDVYPVFQLGIFASLGIFVAWLGTNSLAPCLLVIFWGKQRKSKQDRPTLIGALVKLVVAASRQKSSLKLGMVALALVPAYGLLNLQTDTNHTEFFGESAELTQAYNAVDAAGYAQNPLSILLRYPTESTYSDQEYFSRVVEFEHRLKSIPEIIKLMSVTELLRRIDLTFNEDQTSEAQFRSYAEPQINQLLLLGELSNNDDIGDFLLQDKSQAQILALTPYMSSKQLASFRLKVQQLAREQLPEDLEVVITGATVLWANMDSHVSRTQLISLAGVGSFLVVFLTLNFRSLRLGIIGVVVNFLPLAITLGVMGWLDIKVTIATALIGGISLGVVVDDSIHFLTRFQHELHKGLAFQQAIEASLESVGTNIILTSMILIGGFSCMGTSDYLPSAHFGIFISLAILLALLLDLFLLPALLRFYRPSRRLPGDIPALSGRDFFTSGAIVEQAQERTRSNWQSKSRPIPGHPDL